MAYHRIIAVRPQACAVKRIRRRIFVRRKSAEKVRYTIMGEKYRYTTTVSVC